MARLILITPLWTTQPWFPTILGLLEDYPHQLPPVEDLVLVLTGQEFIRRQGVPELVAWPILGNPSHHGNFSTGFRSPPGGQKQSPTITPCLSNGLIGVTNGIGIPLLDL